MIHTSIFASSRLPLLAIAAAATLFSACAAPADQAADDETTESSEVAVTTSTRVVAGEWTISRGMRFVGESSQASSTSKEAATARLSLASVPTTADLDPEIGGKIATKLVFSAPSSVGGGVRSLAAKAQCDTTAIIRGNTFVRGVTCFVWGNDQRGTHWMARFDLDDQGTLGQFKITANHVPTFDTINEFAPTPQ